MDTEPKLKTYTVERTRRIHEVAYVDLPEGSHDDDVIDAAWDVDWVRVDSDILDIEVID